MHLINKIANYFSPNSCKLLLRKAAAENHEACNEFIRLVKHNHCDIIHKVCENKITTSKQKRINYV
jgi:hypothetical protein